MCFSIYAEPEPSQGTVEWGEWENYGCYDDSSSPMTRTTVFLSAPDQYFLLPTLRELSELVSNAKTGLSSAKTVQYFFCRLGLV